MTILAPRRSVWLEVKAGEMTFRLHPSDGNCERALPAFVTLEAGDVVRFRGETAGEESVTMSGAIIAPIVRVSLTWFERL